MRDRKIIIGVTGGIAAYKAAELVRILFKAGTDIRVSMTANATRFISPLTFETLSGNRVVWDMFAPGTAPLDHITWGQEPDLIIIAPATANFIAKMAHGLADDFLSTMILAADSKILVCPAMNAQMYNSPAVRDNLSVISKRGMTVMDPGEGELACNSEGPGRLPEPEEIAEYARFMLSPHDFSGVKVLVTAGATIEPMDPVRYLSNRSSGKMGYALARAARMRGASATLISGPTALKTPFGVKCLQVKTAEDMRRAVIDHGPGSDVIIKAAAVADYRPRESAGQKIKKGQDSLSLDLVKNPDILWELGKMKEDCGFILVGFAAETEELLANANEKLRKKNLDVIVANDVSRRDAGFEVETNLVKILYKDGRTEDLPLMLKEDVAGIILDRIKEIRDQGL